VADTAQRGSPLLEGLRLPDRYEVRRRIATGGMASVWCADDRVLDRSVAIKLLSTPFAHDVSAVRRFKREARAAARLSSHPHVVTIYDVGHAIEVDEPIGRPFIVMEYLAGGTVADALRVRAVTRELAVRWLREAAAALDYAHGRGVIHRDIKPANLLLDGNRVLHVADFGIARLGTEETFSTTGQVMGTASYIAPEQVVGRPATEASDRYALAVAAFELLVGERPFTAEHFAAQARQHLEEEPPRASSRNGKLPGALDEVLMRGMAKRPEDRWPSAGQFADAVAHAVKARPVPAATAEAPTEATAPLGEARAPRRRPVPEALGRPAFVSKRTRSRRGPALAALAAGAIGVAVAAIASGALGGSGKPLTTSVARRSTAPAHVASTAHTAKPKKHAKRHSTTTATSTPSVTASPAAATATSATADTLQSQGHQLMEGGDYSRAIPLLQQAVSAASPGSLTYAYALYDLGRSLRLSGDPKAAIPVLYRRLQIPNQTETVRQELQLALRAVGAKVSQSGGGGSQGGGPAGHAKHGHGGGPSHGGSGD
jgi:serine/threonine-protein kinase